jgi:hypothetical protein
MSNSFLLAVLLLKSCLYGQMMLSLKTLSPILRGEINFQPNGDKRTFLFNGSDCSLHRYGLAAAFSEIERLSHQVTNAGNPIVMDLKTRYVVKGIGKEQIIDSVVKIHTNGDRITKVEDRWNDQLPDGAFKNVRIFSPSSWLHYAEGWLWWIWSRIWWTRGWKVRWCSYFGFLEEFEKG